MINVFENLEIKDEDIREVCDKFFQTSEDGEILSVHAQKGDLGKWKIEVKYKD